MSARILFGFHAVTVRLKTAPASISEIHVDTARRDARMRGFVDRAREAGARVVDSDAFKLAGYVIMLPFLLAAAPFIAFADYVRETFGE